jgi:hypothetical protein
MDSKKTNSELELSKIVVTKLEDSCSKYLAKSFILFLTDGL